MNILLQRRCLDKVLLFGLASKTGMDFNTILGYEKPKPIVFKADDT